MPDLENMQSPDDGTTPQQPQNTANQTAGQQAPATGPDTSQDTQKQLEQAELSRQYFQQMYQQEVEKHKATDSAYTALLAEIDNADPVAGQPPIGQQQPGMPGGQPRDQQGRFMPAQQPGQPAVQSSQHQVSPVNSYDDLDDIDDPVQREVVQLRREMAAMRNDMQQQTQQERNRAMQETYNNELRVMKGHLDNGLRMYGVTSDDPVVQQAMVEANQLFPTDAIGVPTRWVKSVLKSVQHAKQLERYNAILTQASAADIEKEQAAQRVAQPSSSPTTGVDQTTVDDDNQKRADEIYPGDENIPGGVVY